MKTPGAVSFTNVSIRELRKFFSDDMVIPVSRTFIKKFMHIIPSEKAEIDQSNRPEIASETHNENTKKDQIQFQVVNFSS